MALPDSELSARDYVCLALDGISHLKKSDKNEIISVESIISEQTPYVGSFKVGKELFTRFGPDIIDLIHSLGGRVFLDLKFHDIPNTVRNACKVAAEKGVWLLNVHALGGVTMMKAALEGLDEGAAMHEIPRPKVVAVTILTSINTDVMHDDLGLSGSVIENVLRLAHLAVEGNIDGIVCSAVELEDIKESLPNDFMYVTPGIAGPFTGAGSDQKRIMTPGQAISNGSNLLVIGRAIMAGKDRSARIMNARAVLKDIAAVL